MFRNYVTTAVRNLFKNRLYSAINVSGLAVGLAATILILLVVKDQFSYDSFWEQADDIYLIQTRYSLPGQSPLETAQTMGPAKSALGQEFPEFETIGRLWTQELVVQKEQNKFFENITFADAEILDILSLNFLKGEKGSAFATPDSILLSQSAERKYFGSDAAVGQIVTLSGQSAYVVRGIFEDLPSTSHLDLDFLAPFQPQVMGDSAWMADSWFAAQFLTYARLADNAQISSFRDRMQSSVDRMLPLDSGAKASDYVQFFAVAINDIHFDSFLDGAPKPKADRGSVLAMALTALLILAVACTNFINLTTAASSRRLKEVSLRKIMGAGPRQIFGQFMGETGALFTAAFLISLVLVELFLPWFRDFSSELLELRSFFDSGFALGFFGLLVITALGVGSYPALGLASVSPGQQLHGGGATGKPVSRLRLILVVGQFAVAITMIIATGVMYTQMQLAESTNDNLNPEDVMVLRGMDYPGVGERIQGFQQAVNQLPGVTSSAYSFGVLSDRTVNSISASVSSSGSEDVLTIGWMPVDQAFFETYRFEPVAGRLFGENFVGDVIDVPSEGETTINASAVLNRSALGNLGLGSAEEAIGKRLRISVSEGVTAELTVVGVIENVHFGSIHAEQGPVLFVNDPRFYNDLSIRFDRDLPQEAAIQAVTNIWGQFFPDVPIRYELLQERLDALYGKDGNLVTLLIIFSLLSLVISCLGIFAMAAFTAEQRTKEMGVRKVMGARAQDIIRDLTWQITKPVLLANLIAWPLAWFLMREWLQGFVYRIDLEPMLFVSAGVIVLLIAWATVGGHAFRVARTNPIHALRCE